ncbi:DUF1524 domain-containing protein [Gordonia sp. CPCC 205515]|uniref:GmrSD restriction endonuclease domain-containing protein n=1 Tax=Gordonia sp. CPCC 205515 TaxID=3140791 RepID=UPI003AF3326D
MTNPVIPQRKKSRKVWWIVGAVTAVLVGFWAIGVTHPSEENDDVDSTAASAATAPSTTVESTPSTSTSTATTSPAAATTRNAASSDAALAKLGTLPVKGRAPKTGYARAQFGQAWSDDVTVAGGHNGCDTRNDILRRDLTAITYKPGTRDCTVLSGTLHDEYTGKTIDFTRGMTTSEAVQIDHLVALSDAWQKGAQQLSAEERTDLANDPRNLQAVDGPTNAQKGAGDAATWLPPNKAYRCTYVSRQIDVKALYRLWVTQAEKDAMTRVLTGCGATPPTTTTAVESPPTTRDVLPSPTTRRPAYVAPVPAPTHDDGGESAYYANCTAARAAGAAPLYRGQPGYRSKLDRDGDGVACE